MAERQTEKAKSAGPVDVGRIRRDLKWAHTRGGATKELRRKSIQKCLDEHLPALLARVEELEGAAKRVVNTVDHNAHMAALDELAKLLAVDQ